MISIIASLILSTADFPKSLQEATQASSPPPCSLCHAGGVTTRGTVTTPFGKAMRDLGMVAYNEASLTGAFVALTLAQADSDGDGLSDSEELRAGLDPNVAQAPGLPQPTQTLPVPSYGCSQSGSGTPWEVLFHFACLEVIRRVHEMKSPNPRKSLILINK